MRRSARRIVWLVAGIGAAGCAPVGITTLYNPNLRHAEAERFTNPYPAREGETRYDAVDFLTAGEKEPREGGEHDDAAGSPGLDPTKGFSPADFQQPLDWRAIREPRGVQVTWLGHASFLVQMGGVNILTDPVFTQLPLHWLFSVLERVSPPVVNARQLDFVDAVMISHNHYDHLDFETLEDLPASVQYFVPLRVGRHFGSDFSHLTEMDWYTTARLDGVLVTFVPAQHRSNRTLWDSNETLWGGWVLEYRGTRVYFSGDTAFSGVFAEIHARVGDIDVCLLPATSYRPYAFRHGHLTPEWAVEAAVVLHCKTVIPWGYGTFTLGTEHVLEPVRRLERARDDAAPDLTLRVLRMGETASFE